MVSCYSILGMLFWENMSASSFFLILCFVPKFIDYLLKETADRRFILLIVRCMSGI